MLETEMAAILESKMAANSGSFLRILDFATGWKLILASVDS